MAYSKRGGYEYNQMKNLGPCVCGAKIYADSVNCAVMHELPACEKFKQLEPDEVLAYVRRSRGIPDAQ